VTDAGRDAVDASSADDERRWSGRRSRVVLTPRRRRQVGGKNLADDGDNQARSPGRARRKPLKPLRGGCRVMPVWPWWLTRVFFTLHARLRAHRAPGIPCALWFRMGKVHR